MDLSHKVKSITTLRLSLLICEMELWTASSTGSLVSTEGSVHTRSLTQHPRTHTLSKWQFGSALPDLPKEIFHTWPEFPLQEPRESSWGGIVSQAPGRLGRGLSQEPVSPTSQPCIKESNDLASGQGSWQEAILSAALVLTAGPSPQ